ncbi:hypothetical protein HMPREF9554_02944, partial [Treponema phagedenis F0421]
MIKEFCLMLQRKQAKLASEAKGKYQSFAYCSATAFLLQNIYPMVNCPPLSNS